jgi:hypothetical protein
MKMKNLGYIYVNFRINNFKVVAFDRIQDNIEQFNLNIFRENVEKFMILEKERNCL